VTTFRDVNNAEHSQLKFRPCETIKMMKGYRVIFRWINNYNFDSAN